MTGHGDSVYAEGGETLAIPHMALIGEKGESSLLMLTPMNQLRECSWII